MEASPPDADRPAGGRPGAVVRVIGALRSFDTAMHAIAGLTLLALLALTVADIIGRSAFNNPVPGTVEVTALALVVIVYLGLAHSEDLGDHITVDIVYLRLGPHSRAVLNVVTRLFSFAVMVLVAWQLVAFARRQADGGFTTAVLEWPIWPFVMVAAFGSALFAIAILNKVVLAALGEPTEEAP